MKPNTHTASLPSNIVTPNIANKPSPARGITNLAGLAIRCTRSASRRAPRIIFILVAVVFLLAASAFAEGPALPSFIEVSKKYQFAVAVDVKSAAWTNITGTVTELDTAGWVTIKQDKGPVRHLNIRQVFFVTEAP